MVAQRGATTDFGSVFQLTSGGTYTTLHSFDGPDGGISEAGLIQASDGFLYGATASGGTMNRCRTAFPSGCGAIYRMSTGSVYSVLHELTGGLGGAAPCSTLVQACDGNFYGSAYIGGICCGTIFRITPACVLTTIHRLSGPDGANPRGALIEGADGFLYGTTDRGGRSQNGTIFRISK